VPEEVGFVCASCGQYHQGLAMSYRFPAPAYWAPEYENDPASTLDEEVCVIKGEYFFILGNIEIPVIDAGETFVWTAWVSLSDKNFRRTIQLWTTPGREAEPPYFGWFSTELPVYAPHRTLRLKTNVHTRPLGQRPLIELEPTDHPLAKEQWGGITRARVREIAERMIHQ
jgi:hypothetical protein